MLKRRIEKLEQCRRVGKNQGVVFWQEAGEVVTIKGADISFRGTKKEAEDFCSTIPQIVVVFRGEENLQD